MKKRISLLALFMVMVLCCGCGTAKVNVTKNPDNIQNKAHQIVLSMNPSVITADGQVEQMSKDISDNMSVDISSSVPSLYDNTSWQWAYAVDDGYNQRTIRALESFKDGAGETAKGVPYAYTVTDDRASSLSVFDTSQMDIKTYGDDELPQTGVFFTFTGKEREALIYTANADGKLAFADIADGNITLVKGISSVDTDILNRENSVGVLLKAYINGCIVWQDIIGNEGLLGSEVTSVAFPEIPMTDMRAGDCFVLSAEVITDATDIKTGYFEIPDAATIREKAIKVPKQEEIINISNNDSNNDSNESGRPTLSLVSENGDFNFTVVRPDELTDETRELVDQFVSDIQAELLTTVKYVSESNAKDYDSRIIVGNTNFDASKAVNKEIKEYRSNNACDFIIRFVGKDIIIAAPNDVGLELAFDYFVKNYCAAENMKLPADLNFISAKNSDVKKFSIAGADISEYVIVVPQTASYIERYAADWLAKQLIYTAGADLKVVDDKTPAIGKEIVLGTTNRTSSNYLLSASTKADSGFDYTISVVDNKVYISGSATAVNAGCKELVNIIKGNDTFKNGYKKSGKYDGEHTLIGGYKLMVADEFNGSELSDIWRMRNSLAEAEYGGSTKITEACAYVENGNLVQHAYTDGTNRYGSRLSTQGAILLKYGYCEIRVKYATTPQVCLGFCCYGEPSVEGSGHIEYDIVENLGGKYNIDHTIHHWRPHYFEGNVHNYIYKDDGVTREQWGEKYHTIGFEWDTNELNTYIDGKVTMTIDLTDPKCEAFDYPCNIELTTQFYQEMTNEPDSSFVEDFTYIDYFRIYQKADNDSGISKQVIYQ